MERITILGAGLAGTLMALYLARRGYEVDLFESRPDLRKEPVDYGRSINLALSCRGMTGLKGIGLMDKVEKIMVPMRARAIHEATGEVKIQPFGRHEGEYINAIQRTELNALLLDETDKSSLIRVYFNKNLTEITLHDKRLYFKLNDGSVEHYSYQRLIGADGAGSMVRETLKNRGILNARRDFLAHGYKELSISNTHQHLIKEHLHLWPRDDFLLLGNPNQDESLTGSLFLANEGKNSFSALNTEEKARDFFKQAFSDAYPYMPDIVSEFFNNPTGRLSTIQCEPWHYRDECLLIGDAAHGIVPFFGQGMNSAFEDCRILNQLLDKHRDDWNKAMPAFYKERKPNTDAVAAMSMENYHEIQSDIIDDTFNFRKQLELELMRRYPDQYVSKHVMVMFSNCPYAQAKAYGDIQEALLKEICSKIGSIEEVDWKEVETMISQYDKKLTDLQY